MATRPSLHVAVQGTKNTASNYNDNFDLMMDFIDDSIGEAKDYVDDFMPSISASTTSGFLTNDGTEASWVRLTGIVVYHGGSYAPTGWLVCDGSAVSRTTYADLYSAIGTTYGEGDGETTFNLPDLIDKFPQGNTTVGTEKTAGLPNITGSFGATGLTDNGFTTTGAFNTTPMSKKSSWTFNDGTQSHQFDFNASRSNTIYGNSSTVQPPAITLLPIIKY